MTRPKAHNRTGSAETISNYLSSEQRSEVVCRYLVAAHAANTIRAYQSDLRHFIRWGGSIPATAARIATYIAEHAHILSPATLSRRVVAIGRAHVAKGIPSPTNTELVRTTLKGVRRSSKRKERRVDPLQKSELLAMVRGLRGLKGLRDQALLMIGFAGALRRSELTGLNVEDVEISEGGLVLRLNRSKTDQEGRGRIIAIPKTTRCLSPYNSLVRWLATSGLKEGPLFRPINRYDQLLPHRLSPQSVALIVKTHAREVGLDPARFSGHSLRAGFVTNATNQGASLASIRTHTGHQSDAMLQRYIRNADPFQNNPNLHIW